MDLYLALKLAHVIGATVLLGTGAGIAFFMLMAHRTADPALIAHTARTVVVADTVFTASAVVVQPITGGGLAMLVGYPVLGGWIGLSLILYVVTGLFWLPVSGSSCACAISPPPRPRPVRPCRGTITACSGSGSFAAFPPSPAFWRSSG